MLSRIGSNLCAVAFFLILVATDARYATASLVFLTNRALSLRGPLVLEDNNTNSGDHDDNNNDNDTGNPTIEGESGGDEEEDEDEEGEGVSGKSVIIVIAVLAACIGSVLISLSCIYLRTSTRCCSPTLRKVKSIDRIEIEAPEAHQQQPTPPQVQVQGRSYLESQPVQAQAVVVNANNDGNIPTATVLMVKE